MTEKQSQSGCAHLMIIGLLTVALIGVVGFIYYQNFIQTKDNTVKTNDGKTKSEVKTTVPAVAPATVVNNFLTAYFSYMRPPVSGHSDISFASQSLILTDAYKNSIVNPEGMVYSSPIILAQNFPDSFTVGTATIAGSTSTVPVTLSFKPPYNLVYNLVLVGNEWKIDGVTKA